MSLNLEPNQVCPYSQNCPYNNSMVNQAFCRGADPKREAYFYCDLVENGVFVEQKFRSAFDVTGKMKVILENKEK